MKRVCLFFLIPAALLSGCFLYPRDVQNIPYEGTLPVQISFSVNSGFYNTAQQVTLSCNDPGAALYYTLDGSLVSLEAFKISSDGNIIENSAAVPYTAPVGITATNLLRARAYRGEVPVSKEFSQMYFINETTVLPVFSLVLNPVHLWNDYAGIYVTGANTLNPYIEPYGNENYFQDWERPAYIEFFDTAHALVFGMGGGVKIFGGWSRRFAQKSLALFARAEYGDEAFVYDFFGLTNDLGAPITAYKSLVLRNSGDDWYRTMFRDAFLESLLDGMNVDRQAYRPAVLFLNGQYWGIQNIREKINEDYLAAHYSGVDADAVDILTYYDSRVLEGDNADFLALLDYVDANSLAVQANYDYVAQAVDMDNFIDYTIAQLFVNNTDWPFTNIKFWRPHTAGAKWRWIIYDLDSGFHGKEWVIPAEIDMVDHNSLAYLLSNQADSDFRTLFVSLVQNSGFRTAFVDRFNALLGTNFLPATVTTRINAMAAAIAAEIPRHQARWNAFDADWATIKVQVMRDFAAPRVDNWSLTWLPDFQSACTTLVKNEGLTDGLFWSAGWASGSSAAAFTFDNFKNDEAMGTITAVDPSPQWSDIVLFFQDKINLETAGTYQLSFDVKTSAVTRQIGVALVNPDPWQVYNAITESSYYVHDVTSTSYATKNVTCTVPAPSANVRLLFVAGKVDAGTSVYIDNVSLTYIGP